MSIIGLHPGVWEVLIGAHTSALPTAPMPCTPVTLTVMRFSYAIRMMAVGAAAAGILTTKFVPAVVLSAPKSSTAMARFALLEL